MELTKESFSEQLAIWLLMLALSAFVIAGVHAADKHTFKNTPLIEKM